MSERAGQLEQALLRAWSHKGLWAWLWSPLALVMWGLTSARRLAYARRWLAAEPLPVPVLVVGNRIAGGAGKTPATLAILAHLRARGWQPGVLTRGYGADLGSAPHRLLDAQSAASSSARECGDEPMLIWRRSEVPVMIGRDRRRAGLALLAAHPEVDILVCDDGLQHLALPRDAEVVVFDDRGAGNGWLMPSGPLRESIHSRAGSRSGRPPVVLYNAAAPSTPLPGHLARRRLARLQPLQDWAAALPATGPLQPPREAELWACAGIAQPGRFFASLREQGWRVHGVPLPDHADWSQLADWPWPPEVAHVAITEKDAVKLDLMRLQRERPHTTVWVAALHFDPEPAFWTALDSLLPRAPHA